MRRGLVFSGRCEKTVIIQLTYPRGVPLEDRFFGNANIFSEGEKRSLVSFHPDLYKYWETTTEITKPIYAGHKGLKDVTRMQLIDLNLWLPGDILMKADKMSMAHSLEVRVPFLDKEVFEIAQKIPASLLLAIGTTKYILRKALEGIVPHSVLGRPKLGFPVPLKKWLLTPMGDTILQQITESGVDQWIQLNVVKEMLKQHRMGTADYSRKIWTIYIFSLWHSMYIKQSIFRQALVNS
ncbi:asparagine synthetase B (glutamine-hydrolyzing) [Paenibacillus sp. PastF-3]|nr:asparagine synthetase B (glutamine-hydrolyzing) [Paenibacillus sp. PastF-3]